MGTRLVHLDLASPSAAGQGALVERLTSLGAAPADVGQGDVPWVVLADPRGQRAVRALPPLTSLLS
jgi:Glyoxalase-like domain